MRRRSTGNGTTMVLSPDSEFFRFFRNAERRDAAAGAGSAAGRAAAAATGSPPAAPVGRAPAPT